MAQIDVGKLGLKLTKYEIVEQIAELIGRQLDVVHHSWSMSDFDLVGNNRINYAKSSLSDMLTEDPIIVELLKIAMKIQQLPLKKE